MSQKERVDLIEVDLLDMCKYILSKWVFILIGMVVFAGAGFGYAKVKGKTEYSSRMKVYVTIPKTSDKILIRDSASELTYDYVSLAQTDLILDKVAKESKVPRKIVRDALQAVVVDGTRIIEFQIDTSNKENAENISKKVIPVYQDVVQNKLGRNKLIVVSKPSKVEAKQTISVKEFTIIGAIVWGIYGLFDVNIVAKLFANVNILEKAIYVIVGICGLINIGLFFVRED